MNYSPTQDFIDLNQLQIEFDISGYDCEVLNWGYFDGNEWWRNYLHIHSFFEVCYVVKGAGSFIVDNEVMAVQKADVFIAKPNERHEIISSTEDPLSICFWAYTLTPKQEEKTNNELVKLFDAFSRSKIKLLSQQTSTSEILKSLNHEISKKHIGYNFNIKHLCHLLIIEVARAFTNSQTELHQTNKFSESSYKHTVVNTIIRYIQDNYSQPLVINEIAAQVRLSERHVSRLFKSVTGFTIKQYLTQLRIDVAKQRLLNPSLAISDIAFETGYEDQRHFSTVFRKTTGSSPTQYRNTGGTNFM